MKLFPLHLIPNDTKIDFMRWRKPTLSLMSILLQYQSWLSFLRDLTMRWNLPAAR